MTTDQATRDAQLIAEALTAAGFDPAPAVGQVWHHHTINYLPEGQRRLVRITGLYKVEAGWSATVQAWIDGAPCPADHEMGDGVIFLKTLAAEYTLIEEAHGKLAALDPEAKLDEGGSNG